MRYVTLLPIFLAFAPCGCGPTAVTTAPPTVNVARGGDDSAELQGTWRVAHLDLPEDFPADELPPLKTFDFTLTGDLLKVLLAGDPNPIYFRVQRDQKVSPRTVQFTRTDEKGQPIVPDDTWPANLFGFYKFENGLLSVEISSMKDARPRDFKAGISEADGSNILVVHLRKKG